MAIAKLPSDEVEARLRERPGWTVRGGKLHRELAFADFVEAFAFMAASALVAERMNHHPEWFNVWNRVVIDLVTHDAGGISERDFRLAAEMDRLAGARGG